MAEKENKGSWTALFIVVATIAIGIGVLTKNITGGNSDSQEQNTASTTDKYTDALKKCTVMEAADIYTTGIGGNKNTAFDDAQQTCAKWYVQWGEDDFYDAVYGDWDNRRDETIEGKKLEYYLENLGW